MFSLGFYSYNLTTVGLSLYRGETECIPLDKWLTVTRYMTLADIFLTILVPFMLISIFNTLIVIKLTGYSMFPLCFNKLFAKKRNSNTSGLLFLHSYFYQRSSSSKSQKKVKFSNSNDELNQKVYLENSASQVTLDTKYPLCQPRQLDAIDVFSQSVELTENTVIKSKKKFKSKTMIRRESKSYMSIMAISNITKRKKIYSRTTLVLLSISTMYLLLHFPIALTKIFYFFENSQTFNNQGLRDSLKEDDVYSVAKGFLTRDQEFNLKNLVFNSTSLINKTFLAKSLSLMNLTRSDPFDAIIEKITSNLYYLSFTLNFFLYSLNGTRFRKSLRKMLCF